MADEEFRHPRLAAVYDALDPDRADLDVYVELIGQLDGKRLLDVGCGTGTLALILAERGYDVVGVDTAPASLEVARGKDSARRVRWVDGDASAVQVADRDVAVMTANVAQAIADPTAWGATLQAIHAALRPGGYLIFESRDPADQGWERWNPDATYESTEIAGVGSVTSWTDLITVDGPMVTFRTTWIFASDGETLTSTSTLRFRHRTEIEADLDRQGFAVVEVRDAPDRPGREFVFIAHRVEPA